MKKPNFKFPSFESSQSQPVFNKPFDTERQYVISRTIYLTLLSLMVGLSMGVIALKAMTLDFIEENLDTGFAFNTGDPDPTILAALPKNLYVAPAELAMVAAVAALCVGVGHLGFVGIDWNKGKTTQSYCFRRNVMFLHFTNTILILFSLVSTFVTHKSASHFRQNYIMRKADRVISNPDVPNDSAIQYNIGTFDLETWSCELRSVPGAQMVWEDYSKQCGIERAGRWIMIPLLVVGAGVASWTIVCMMRGRWDGEGRRLKTEDVRQEEEGLEMGSGKFNAL